MLEGERWRSDRNTEKELEREKGEGTNMARGDAYEMPLYETRGRIYEVRKMSCQITNMQIGEHFFLKLV